MSDTAHLPAAPSDAAIDLYAILGVERTADVIDIRRAYRERSKTLHPDVPETGSTEKFNQLRLARDILTNPRWRENYDAIGVIPRDQADNAAAELITQLTGLFGQVMQGVLSEGKDPSRGDFIAAMQKAISGHFQQVNAQIEALRMSMNFLRPMAGRFRMTSFEQPNHMETIVEGQVANLQRQIDQQHAQLRLLETARLYLNDVAFFKGPM